MSFIFKLIQKQDIQKKLPLQFHYNEKVKLFHTGENAKLYIGLVVGAALKCDSQFVDIMLLKILTITKITIWIYLDNRIFHTQFFLRPVVRTGQPNHLRRVREK